MNENVIGREVWVEMDEDKSATRFSPRKGMVVHIFGGRPEVQEVVVRLMPPALRFLPIPHRMRHIVLRYRFREKENLERTFQRGNSYAEVLELKHKRAVEKDSLSEGDVDHLGAALVFSWPKPGNAEVNKMTLHRENRIIAFSPTQESVALRAYYDRYVFPLGSLRKSFRGSQKDGLIVRCNSAGAMQLVWVAAYVAAEPKAGWEFRPKELVSPNANTWIGDSEPDSDWAAYGSRTGGNTERAGLSTYRP